MAVLCVTEQWTSVRVVRKEQGGVDERGAEGAKEFVGDTDRAPKARGSRRRVGGVWEGVSPSPLREESGGLCPLRRKFFDIGTQNGGFWCILGAIFTTSAACGIPSLYISRTMPYEISNDAVHLQIFLHMYRQRAPSPPARGSGSAVSSPNGV